MLLLNQTVQKVLRVYHGNSYIRSKCLFHSNIKLLSRAIRDPENVGAGQQGVNFDTLGSWNNRLELPILVEESIKKGRPIPEITCDKIATSSLLGRRKDNEDRVSVIEVKNGLLLCGIFDGHSGYAAAEFVNQTLVDHIRFWLNRQQSFEHALIQSFSDVNNRLAKFLHRNYVDTEQSNAGTTATVCLLEASSKLYVGHVGDSRAILCRKGNAIRLTRDHDPENSVEVERITQCKGYVQRDSFGRTLVNGRLAMTRSIGDMELKPFGVICTPDTLSIDIKHGYDAFLVLTSDGLNCVLSDQEIVDIINNCSDPTEAADFITDQALHFGSQDNATSIVIPFGAWGKFRGSTTVLNSFGRMFSRSVFD